jgi:hypothetical protein
MKTLDVDLYFDDKRGELKNLRFLAALCMRRTTLPDLANLHSISDPIPNSFDQIVSENGRRSKCLRRSAYGSSESAIQNQPRTVVLHQCKCIELAASINSIPVTACRHRVHESGMFPLRRGADCTGRRESETVSHVGGSEMISQVPGNAIPNWLHADALQSELPIGELLANSVYYPACRFDGTPVKYLAGNFHSFVFVDYGVTREQLSGKLDQFRGYTVAAFRDIAEPELVPSGWEPQLPDGAKGTSRRQKSREQPPFGVWSVHERTDEYGPEHGPERFSLLYICGDGVATFQALYHGNRTFPAVVVVIQPGTGFGGNWTDFEDEEESLAEAVLCNPAGVPDYLLFGGWGDGSSYRRPCWPVYSEPVAILHGRLRCWRRPKAKD